MGCGGSKGDDKIVESLREELRISKKEVQMLKQELERMRSGFPETTSLLNSSSKYNEIDYKKLTKSLEEYILKLNHTEVQHPKDLDYLLTKSLGTYTYPNGHIYTGELIQGIPNGKGEKVGLDGAKVIGIFLDGKKHGKNQTKVLQSEEISAHVTESNYYMGAKQGFSISTYESGEVRSGAFTNNLKQGVHKIAFSDGSFRFSEFVQNLQHGFSFYFIPKDGFVIVSTFKAGLRTGKKMKFVFDAEINELKVKKVYVSN